ncbi:MAG TPA: hypothetical protein VI296_08115, partial [Candidatus Dormibacteraeota bacterium]
HQAEAAPIDRGVIPDTRLGDDADFLERRDQLALIIVEVGEQRAGCEGDVSQVQNPVLVDDAIVAARGRGRSGIMTAAANGRGLYASGPPKWPSLWL